MTAAQNTGRAYFEALYATEPDPWGYETSAYEAAKYDETLAILGTTPVPRALEIGCSIGVLTARLAPLCAALLAVDVAATALHRARLRCASLPQVSFAQASIPAWFPEGAFDLVVLSEVLYYLNEAELNTLAAQLRAHLAPGGRVLLVHWLGETNAPLSGDEAASLLIAATRFPVAVQRRFPRYRIDLLQAGTRQPERSGIVSS